MLATLRIQDFALIDEVEIDFEPGFNVLTGETGAGKSILLGALNLVLGARASAEMVRTGARRAHVEAVVHLERPSRRLKELLDAHGLELDDGNLLLARSIGADGRGRAYAAGRLVPASLLSELGDELVDLHGQHEHQSLLRTDRQREFLDAFAGAEAEAGEVAREVAELRRLEQERAALMQDDREQARRVDYLRHEVNEISQAGLVPGEEEELRGRRRLIVNAEQICALSGQAYTALYESDEEAAIDKLDAAMLRLEELSRLDERFAPLAEQLSTVRASLESVATEVRAYTEAADYDPQELDAVNQRLSLLSDLKRKYGDSVAAILEYAREAQREIDAFTRKDEHLEQLSAKLEQTRARAMEKARALSRKRSAAGRRLEKELASTLHQLGMKDARLTCALSEHPLSASGIDEVAFLLRANAGERPKPLRQTASGGELSRIMLAIKAAFAKADRIPTLVFDEIDAGIGGSVAAMVAKRLAGLAASHQVICITHLPQIAAAASNHFRVVKAAQGKRSTTVVVRIDSENRVEELARLLDGSVSDVSLQHARALLETS